MSKRDWYSKSVPWLIVLGGVVIFAAAYAGLSVREAHVAGQRDQATSQAYEEVRQGLEGCGEASVVKEALECVKRAIESAREPARSEEDLGAQQDMAYWAFWVVLISGVQAVLSLGGVVLLVQNLSVARESNQNALKAIDIDNRPWLDFDIEPASDLGRNDTDNWPEGIGFDVKLGIRNHGKNPATGIVAEIEEVTVMREDFLDDYDLDQFRNRLRETYRKGRRKGVIVFPSEETEIYTRLLVSADAVKTSPRIARLDDKPSEVSLLARYAVCVFYTSNTTNEALETSSVFTIMTPQGRNQFTTLPIKVDPHFRNIPKKRIRLFQMGYKRAV